PPVDNRRAIERAQAQYEVGDYPTGLPLDVFGMQRVSPDQLSGVFSAQSAGRSALNPASQLEMTSLTAMPGTGSVTPGVSAGSAPGLSSDMGIPYGTGLYNPLGSASFDQPLRGMQISSLGTGFLTAPRRVPPLSQRQNQPALTHRANPYADVPS